MQDLIVGNWVYVAWKTDGGGIWIKITSVMPIPDGVIVNATHSHMGWKFDSKCEYQICKM
jgi:hypothetical protein